jgi:hypothetical protein
MNETNTIEMTVADVKICTHRTPLHYEGRKTNSLEQSGREEKMRYMKGDFEVNTSNSIEKVQNSS